MRRFIASTVTPSTRPPFTGRIPFPGILQVNRAEIPVYFLHGRYDYTVSYTLAKSCLEVFQAPEKAFFTFEYSARRPHFEEPERVREVPERILKGRERLKRRPGAERLRKSGKFVIAFTGCKHA